MKNIRKRIALILAVVLVLTAVPAVHAFGDDLVAINSTNFTDATFRYAVADAYDDNGDGYLSADERNITLMSISGLIDDEVEEIKDLKGIEFFTSLRILRCGGIGLEHLDVSGLPNLTSLTCQGNRLTSLDISGNTALVTVNCSDNEIETLTIPVNNSITTLYCYANNLRSLDTTYLRSIVNFRCDQNDLSTLFINARTLVEFNCSQNHLTYLDLSQTSLTDVTEYMIGNQTITLTAQINNGRIYIPFTNSGLYASNYRGCTLDEENGSGMNSSYSGFYAGNVAEIDNGFTYDCFPLLEGSENMSVNVTVQRSFHQVDFYSDNMLSNKLCHTYVEDGQPAITPEVTDCPQCKAFDSWDQDVSAVDRDIITYAVYKDAHSYAAFSLAADGDTVHISCSECGAYYTVSFISMINTTPSDAIYDSAVDMNNDGFINAKDYAVLNKMR